MAHRPGFVLEVDRSTPPTMFMHGEGFRLERLPVGSRIVYPSEAIDPIKDIDGAIRHALLNPIDSDPLDRHTEALRHAAEAGRRGAVKVAFDLRQERERERL